LKFLYYIVIGIITILLSFSFGPHPNHINKANETEKDTLSAMVSYGDNWLTRQAFNMDKLNLSLLVDSLYDLDEIPFETIDNLYFVLKIQQKEEYEINTILDSLFQLDTIPYALINEINYYLSIKKTYDFPQHIDLIPQNNSPYPANGYYQSWVTNEHNPYKYDLWKKDSSHVLILVDSTWNCGFSIPFEGKKTSSYGWRDGKNHNGIDIDLEVWNPVVSAFPGMVRIASTSGGFGRLVVIRHYNGLETYYAHLHRYKVKAGDIVEAGQVIGLGGSSGHSSGSHLHFEIRFKGIPINPENIISFQDAKLLSDTILIEKIKYGYSAIPKGTLLYTVRKGDYLYKIAQEFGISVKNLCSLNGINRNSFLRVGQKLRIKT
jgi:murein DD-endopeptidase MepM/ murein hydrolase activator NlpD